MLEFLRRGRDLVASIIFASLLLEVEFLFDLRFCACDALATEGDRDRETLRTIEGDRDREALRLTMEGDRDRDRDTDRRG